ncbi:hypothetical protein [Blastococcus sp. SYSU DS0828]
MDAAATTAWLVTGVVLGVLAVAVLVAATAVVRARRSRAAGAPDPVDDLADFHEHPPGTRPEPPSPAGWATLAPPSVAPALPGEDHGRGRAVLAALCVVALAVVGTAAAVAAGRLAASGSAGGPGTDDRGTPGPAPTSDAGAPDALVADLVAGGLVLEPRAVGVTAAYPEARLTTSAGTARLELRLPTYNCLAAEAPADPVAAGCTATPVEHAVVEGEDLVVSRDGERWTVRGRAPTVLRPGGSAPEPTGRVYPLELTLVPQGAPAADSARAATGELRLGTGSAPLLPERSRVHLPG